MKTILVIDDGSAAAKHAAHFALHIALKVKADLVLARVCPVKQLRSVKQFQLVGHNAVNHSAEAELGGLLMQLQQQATLSGDFVPSINAFCPEHDMETELSAYIIKNNIWMMVKGAPESGPYDQHVKVQAILNRIACPLMLIPEKYNQHNFHHIIYTADLRYCRLPVLRFLAALARPYQADLVLAHLSAKGLPHMEQQYALTVFSDEVSKRIDYEKLYFNNIRERDICRAVDVMVNTMHADLLAVVHHCFHCEELLPEGSRTSIPSQITIPVLVFPY